MIWGYVFWSGCVDGLLICPSICKHMIMRRWCYLEVLFTGSAFRALNYYEISGIACWRTIFCHISFSWMWHYNLEMILAEDRSHLAVEKWKNFWKYEFWVQIVDCLPHRLFMDVVSHSRGGSARHLKVEKWNFLKYEFEFTSCWEYFCHV